MQPLMITAFDISPYKKSFKKPFNVAGQSLSYREGYYGTFTANSLSAQGEASPLEGFSSETLKKSAHDLKLYGQTMVGQSITTDKEQLFTFLRNALKECAPSSRFAIESALIQLVAQARGQSLAEFLGVPLKKFLPVALLQGDHKQILEETTEYVKAGYRFFKLKVGNRNVPLDVAKVQAVRSVLPSDGTIRLDANRAWSVAQAVTFVQHIGRAHIQFIEEPLSDPSQLAEFAKQAHIPVALDETLMTSRCDVTAPGRCMPTLTNSDAVDYYVIKPSLLGGVLISLDWIEQAKRLGKKAVISSMFETSVGQTMLMQLASHTDQAPGFGTESWLA